MIPTITLMTTAPPMVLLLLKGILVLPPVSMILSRVGSGKACNTFIESDLIRALCSVMQCRMASETGLAPAKARQLVVGPTQSQQAVDNPDEEQESSLNPQQQQQQQQQQIERLPVPTPNLHSHQLNLITDC
jgi:hypothetical protein